MSLKVYADGVGFISPLNKNPQTDHLEPGKGQTLGVWGKGARRKFIARCAYLGDIGKGNCKTFILTYRDETIPDGKTSKKQINAMLQYLRRRDLQGYAYSAEIGEQGGMLHYHFLASFPKWKATGTYTKQDGTVTNRTWKHDLNDAWCNIRGDYAPNAVRAIERLKKLHGASGYASKAAAYASKCASLFKEPENKMLVPSDIRVWATSNNLIGNESFDVSDIELIEFAREKAKSIREINTDTGISIESLFLDKETIADLREYTGNS
jgi:hypothetical protein